jgi:Tol biopolymer transport system component
LQLTKPPMEVEVSSWSPDGRRIAFMGREHNNPYRIRLVSRDGGPIEEAAEGSDSQGGPSWSPDGKEIVYANVYGEDTQTGWVRRIDLATRKERIVPESHNFRTARWSPDDKYIAALNPKTQQLMLCNVRTQRWRPLAASVTGDNIYWSSDSRFIYADSPRVEGRLIERVSIEDGSRITVVNLASFQKMPGRLNNWMGLTPDDSPIVFQLSISSEVYRLTWTDR